MTPTVAEIREAIERRPTDPALRRALAEALAGTPEGSLASTLVGLDRADWRGRAIRSWFLEHQRWPIDPADSGCACEAGPTSIVDHWLLRATDPDRWPDRSRWRRCVASIALRQLANARTWFEPGDFARETLERIAAIGPADLPGPVADPTQAEPTELDRRFTHIDLHSLALEALAGGQMVTAMMGNLPGSDAGEGAVDEWSAQFVVVGWGWLGLPPVEPEAEAVPRWDLASADPDRAEPARRVGWWRRWLGL